MARSKRAPKPPAYSRYQQWVDAGRDYWAGVSLLNALPRERRVPPTLRSNLNARKSQWNVAKLQHLLKMHLSGVPGARAMSHEPRAASLPPPQRTVPLHSKGDEAVSETVRQERPEGVALGPEVDLPWTDSKYKLPTFAQLPDVLKQARIENMKKFNRACALHSALNDRIEEPWKGTIHLRDALRMMYDRQPTGALVPFSYQGYTFNRRNREGGSYVSIGEAVMLVEDALPNPRTLRDKDADKKAKAQDLAAKHKPGDHFRNATRDFLLPDGAKQRVIIWTMMRFNGMRVVLGTPRDAGWSDADDKRTTLQLLDELIENMDAVCIAWDIERRWQQHGALPDVPDDLRTQFSKLPLHKLQNVITNSLRPKVSRWKKAAEERDGDDLVEARMQLGAAETELALALEVMRTKEAAS